MMVRWRKHLRSLFLFLFGIFVSVSISQKLHPKLTLPLYGDYNSMPFYWTLLPIGSPPVTFSVIMDTGSSNLLIPNYNCTTCVGDASTFYSAVNSSTAVRFPCKSSQRSCETCTQIGQCVFTVSYTGISEKAELFADAAYINNIPLQVNFGAITDVKMGNTLQQNRFKKFSKIEENFFYPEGVVGFAYPELASAKALPFFDSVVAGLGVDDVFSTCYAPSGKGGMLMLGGILPYFKGNSATVSQKNERMEELEQFLLKESVFMYTPLFERSFYNIKMKDLRIGSQSIGIPPHVYNTKYCIVDSGTPALTVPTLVFEQIHAEMLSLCSTTPLKGVCKTQKGFFDGKCVELSDKDLSQFPTISLVLEGGLVLELPPSSYLRHMYYCKAPALGLAIQNDPSGFGTVLGMPVLQRYVTVYDRTSSRLGFALSQNCPETK